VGGARKGKRQRRGNAERPSEDSTGFVREFFRPFGGATFDESPPRRDKGRQALGWVWIWERTHPGAMRHPSKEGILREGTFSDVLCLHLRALSVLAVRSFGLNASV